MADTHPGDGDAEKLKRFWSHGKGAAEIRWGTPGDFNRCVVKLTPHLGEGAKGYCADRHHDALGIWPATHAKLERGKASMATEATTKAPYGNVEYADPGLRGDKQKRYPLDTDAHIRAAWSYINQKKNAALYSPADLKKVRARIAAAMKRIGAKVSSPASEAQIGGQWSYSDVQDMVRDALKERIRAQSGTSGYVWCSVVDLTDSDVVYADDLDCDDLWLCSYTMDAAGAVTLGEPERVVRTYAPAPANMPPDDDAPGQPGASDDAMAPMSEARIRIAGRVLEAKADNAAGGRVFRTRVIRYGDSKNGRRYSEAVMRAAAPLYEGARAFDHHRTDGEMATSTIAGLVGHFENVTATSEGLEADLHLLPGATHAADVLDASLAAQDAGRPALAGISHDVQAQFRPITEGGRRLQETTAIVGVNSADIVTMPAAGGAALRAVAGGEDLDEVITDDPAPAGVTEGEGDVPVKTEDVLASLAGATPEQLAAAGLRRAEATEPDPEKATEAAPGPQMFERDSVFGRFVVTSAVEAAQLPGSVVESLTAGLPERFSEADVTGHVASLKKTLAGLEKAGLVAQLEKATGTAQVTQESHDKKVKALDAFFTPNDNSGYRSFKEAFIDISGKRPKALDLEDFNRAVLVESFGDGRIGVRTEESLVSSTWNVVLGDSITRRLVAEYNQPSLQTYKSIVSSTVPVNDFRTQRIDRIGGYGTLPAVNQGAPYQPLTSPTNEEVTYAITKRGGTEDLTLEMIANDDVRAISRIPVKLGLAAAQTLYRFVWDFLNSNATLYDSVALFNAAHANTATAAALSQTSLSTARRSMRVQTAYGDTADILSLTPKILVVNSALEEIAYQLANSAVAIPATPAGPSNTPNIHENIQVVLVDYFTATSATEWFIVADPMMCPTFELGFYQGQETPQLFTQSDPTVGSMFDADKFTYKIRHIYSGAVLDWRGFQRGNT